MTNHTPRLAAATMRHLTHAELYRLLARPELSQAFFAAIWDTLLADGVSPQRP